MTAGSLRRIAIAVDDVGLHPGICEAVLELAHVGRVQAAGCMVGGDRWAADAIEMRQLPRTQVELGLHFDLTEVPLRMKPVRRLPLLWTAAYARTLPKAALVNEIDAQLDAFERAIGRPPDFVDGHQHVHQLPVIRAVLLERLSRRYAGTRPWLRATRRPFPAQGDTPRPSPDRTPLREAFKPWLIELLGAKALATGAASAGFAQNRALIGSYDFSGGADRYARLVAAWLDAAADGDLLMTHPSTSHFAADDLRHARQNELTVLAGDAFGAALNARSMILATIGQIRATSARPGGPSAGVFEANHQARGSTAPG
jgi:predicted glycoside hydrolase/deacetylase ChbG (UPF0249 family)